MAQFSTIQFLETVSNLIGEAIHRFNTEEALRKSQASLSEAQRLAHVGNWEWDVDTGLSKWSDEVYRIFSLSPQVKPTYNSFLYFVHSDDRESLVQPALVPVDEWRGRTPVEIIGGERFPPMTHPEYLFTLGPHSLLWLRLEHV